MPRYEYKVVTIPMKLGFDFEQKCRQLEESMNELGAEGWKFCASLNGAFLLMREVEESARRVVKNHPPFPIAKNLKRKG